MPAAPPRPPVFMLATALTCLSLVGCAGRGDKSLTPGAGANRPLTVAAPPATEASAPESPAEVLARRVEQFAQGLDVGANAQATTGDSSADGVEPAIPGEPAVVRVTRSPPAEAVSSVVAPLNSPTAPAPPAVSAATPSWDVLPAPTQPKSSATATLEDAVARRLRDRPTSAANVLDYELLRLLDPAADDAPRLAGAVDDAPVTTGDLTSEDQRLLGVVRDGLADFRRTLRRADGGPTPLPSEKAQPLLDMGRALRRQVGLTLPTVALCSEVKLFGSYEPLPTSFPAGKAQLTILYVEVDGFASRELPSGEWETKMALSATLYDADGRAVLTLPEAQAVDRSRQQRRDFYLCSYLTLPADTKPGPLTLKVSVRDELSRRISQQSLKLTLTP